MMLQNLFFVVAMLLLLVSVRGAGYNRCKDNERRALLDFKAYVLDYSEMLSSWGNNSEQDCCDWRGIRCNNRTGHVILINLPGLYSHLVKVIPSLSELKHLKYLNLSGNFFNGEIPPQLGNLTNLRSLDLGGGFGLKAQNLEWVSHLHLLTNLDLSFVNLSRCNDWLNQINKLSSLTHLHLEWCDLPISLLPFNDTSFSAFNSLAVVDLSSNYFISPKGCKWLFNFTTTLVHLDLSYDFERGGIPEAFGRFTSLESLILRGNKLEGMLPNSFRNLSQLATLNLYDNNLNGSLPEFLSPFATNEKNSIQVLDLSCNQLDGSLPDYLTRFTSLREMYITSNNLSGPLPDSFWQLSSSLVHLELELNKITGPFPDTFLRLSSRLVHLDLSYNQITGPLPDNFGQLSSRLVHLDMSYNQITGPFPDNFWQISSRLVHLDLSHNQITGPFPDNFWQLSSSLVVLDLSYNQITGPFPNLTLFSSIESLILCNNRLKDTVPQSYLSNLSKLTILDLSSNSLSFNFSSDWVPPFQIDQLLLRNCSLGPHFPSWIISQGSVSALDISHNDIYDTIPPWFWDLSLTTLNMSNNQIEGVLPDLFLANLDVMDLSNNLLRGNLPAIHDLKILDLSNNMFTGSLSLFCTRFWIIIYLDLSDNKLSGELPEDCLTHSYQLSTLNLANNNFSGNIPNSIGLLSTLRILQLRNNNFTGQLPSSMMNFTYLEFLDLSENKLSGKVPFWIGTQLTSLIVLSLRNNMFSGGIPPHFCHLRNAQVLDLSQNYLTGGIPHCINNFTSMVDKETNNGAGPPIWVSGQDYQYANALVQWKGITSEYGRILRYLKLIDLSSNRLVGHIPDEFTSLKGLISLNLSSNSLTGDIIPNIGQMENLENLDLSRNHLSGKIPSGLASLTLLNALDLSNNNLEGEIPTSTQLQSFDPSKYAGNEQLCGLPLPNKCRGKHSPPTGHDDKEESNEEGDDEDPKFWMYVTAALGFVTGLWGFIGPVLLRRSWRHSYYKLLGSITDWIYIMTILLMTRLRRKFTAKRSI